MEITCDFQDKCIIKKIKEDEHIQLGDCLISHKVGMQLCNNCDERFKELLIKENEKYVSNNKKV